MCNLSIVSDEACAGIGVDIGEDPYLAQAQAQLQSNEWRSFCLHVAANKVAVLAKQHTPQRGCTIRSLSHNLALYTPAENQRLLAWAISSGGRCNLDVFNLLLLPWPTAVAASDFHVSSHRVKRDTYAAASTPNRYFDYQPKIDESPMALSKRVEMALDSSVAYADRIHAIVLPETALTPQQFAAVESVAIKNKALLISGLRAPASKPGEMPINACAIQPIGLTAVHADKASSAGPLRDSVRQVQLKHHRWCLDRGQILQYVISVVDYQLREIAGSAFTSGAVISTSSRSATGSPCAC